MECMICHTPYESDFKARIGACENMDSYTAFYENNRAGERIRAHNDNEAVSKAIGLAERHNDKLMSLRNGLMMITITEEMLA